MYLITRRLSLEKSQIDIWLLPKNPNSYTNKHLYPLDVETSPHNLKVLKSYGQLQHNCPLLLLGVQSPS